MLADIKNYCKEINELLQELETYEGYKEQLESDLSALDKRYETGIYSYRQYMELKSRLFGTRTKEGLFNYYDAYIISLIKKIDFLNTQIFSEVYTGKDAAARAAEEASKEPLEKPSIVESEEPDKSKKPKSVEEGLIKLRPILADSELKDYKKSAKGAEVKTPIELETKPEPEVAPKLTGKLEGKRKEKEKEPMDLEAEELGEIEIPRPRPRRELLIPKPKKGIKGLFKSSKKKTLFDEIQEEEGLKPSTLKVGSILNLDVLKNIKDRFKRRNEFIGNKTEVSPNIIRLSREQGEEEFKAGISPTLMTKQAERLRSILMHKKIKVYNPSSIGFLANVTVRRLVLYLMDQFPAFFKRLYFSLRYSNIKILSNTYVNIMFFITLLTFFVTTPLALVLFSFQKVPFFVTAIRALFFGMIFSGLSFAFFYLAPGFKIKKRIRSINTNLPFAIDHMSSVATSGVPPGTMFKLIAGSKEYGEVSVEIEKISNYIEFFGYDIISAMRSIAAITPSQPLKEFFDGFVSTIESGGDLKNYLTQKSKEALLTYRLERQKYVEAVSTYSDIYTGVLIAAPLFFVSTLALVSMLGGVVGGVAVSGIIALGTYVVIPVLNILFIVFLEINQPQI